MDVALLEQGLLRAPWRPDASLVYAKDGAPQPIELTSLNASPPTSHPPSLPARHSAALCRAITRGAVVESHPKEDFKDADVPTIEGWPFCCAADAYAHELCELARK